MSSSKLEDRLSAALDRALASWPSGVPADDELIGLLGTAAFLSESLAQVPASEPFRTSLREWLERAPEPRWWQDLVGAFRRRVPVPGRRPAIRVALGAGAAAAIVIGVLVVRNRRAAAAGIAG